MKILINLMQDPFSQEDFIDDFKSKQINAIFFSNEAPNDNIKNNGFLLDDDDSIYKQDISNTSNTNSTSSDKIKYKRKKISSEKKKIILEKNRESARESRRRKKQIIENLLKENRELKRELHEYKKHLFVNLCKECKSKLNLIPNKPIIQQCNNVPQMQSRKPFSLFTVCAAVICIILNIAYFSDFFSTSSNSLLRQLSHRNIVTYQEIEKVNITVGSVFISYGDYYSITNGKQFLRNEVFYTFENKGKVRRLYNEEIGKVPVTECPSCMIEIPRSNIVQKKGKIGFKLFVNTKRFWEHKANNDTLDNYNTLLELDCETTGYSQHIMNIHSNQKIQ